MNHKFRAIRPEAPVITPDMCPHCGIDFNGQGIIFKVTHMKNEHNVLLGNEWPPSTGARTGINKCIIDAFKSL